MGKAMAVTWRKRRWRRYGASCGLILLTTASCGGSSSTATASRAARPSVPALRRIALGFQWSMVGADPAARHGGAEITGLDCWAKSACVAVDSQGNALVSRKDRRGQLVWSMRHIDSGRPLAAVSCLAAGACAAVDAAGRILEWHPLLKGGSIQIASPDHGHMITTISCVTGWACVAADDLGTVLTKNLAPGNPMHWVGSGLEPGHEIIALSCTALRACVAIDARGYVLVSSRPSGGARLWKVASRALATQQASFGSAVGCNGTGGCAVVAHTGEVAIHLATAPPPREWRIQHIDDDNGLDAAVCPSRTTCLLADDSGNVVASQTVTRRHPSWRRADIDGQNALIVMSCWDAEQCVAGGSDGDIFAAIARSTP
jgi:hypothetical protein